MEKAKVTWYLKQGEEFVPSKNHHAGSFTNNEKIKVDIQVWNNRWGVEDVEDIESPIVNLYFDTLEDSALLRNCKVILNGYDQLPLTIREEKASAAIGKKLSGKGNNGSDKISANRDNFFNLTFELDLGSSRLKNNDLKGLNFEIVSMD